MLKLQIFLALLIFFGVPTKPSILFERPTNTEIQLKLFPRMRRMIQDGRHFMNKSCFGVHFWIFPML